MNITEALGEITAQFPRVERSLDEAGEPSVAFEVSSGGLRERARDPEPTLYITSDAAIVAWRDQMLALLKAEKAARFSVFDGPHLDRWRITVADGNYTHRTAEDRYSVTARIGVIRETAATPCPSPENPCMCRCHVDSEHECHDCKMGRHKPRATDADPSLASPTAAPELPKPKPAKAAKKKAA